MRYLLLVAMLAMLLAGCGSTGGSGKPTAVAQQTSKFTDPVYKFSFAYPSDWSVEKRGKTVDNGGTTAYELAITLPGDQSQVQIEVDNQITPFPQFTNGHRGTIGGDPHVYVYFHRRVGQWQAMRIERQLSGQVDEIDTVVNTRTLSYDARILTGNPPFTASDQRGYETIVKSLRIPFS